MKRTKNYMKRKIIKTIFLLAVIILCMLATSCYFINSEKNSKVETLEDSNVIVVLGAGLWGDQVSPQLSLRLHTAMDLMNQSNDIVTIVSGGQGSDELISEAEAMKKYLVALGANSENIYLEDQSTSTTENLEYSKSLIEKLGINHPEIILVTTDFHMFRAKMIANRLGMQVLGQSAPNIDSIKLKNNVREVFALIKDYIIQ